jgi:hypothetical protein
MRQFSDEFENREVFREYLKLYKFKAKELVERYGLLKTFEEDSPDYRIHGSVLFDRLIPQADEMGSLVYSAIRRYNEGENPMDLTPADVQEAQLVQDEVVTILREAGVNVNYTSKDFPAESSH